jgi:serralysin
MDGVTVRVVSRVAAASAAVLFVVLGALSAQAAHIRGTDGSDRLVGTAGPDRIRALRGEDWVSGRGGRDTVFGGGGADVLHARGGKDLIFADKGRDLVLGERGRDALIGGPGDDVVKGGTGSDILGNPAPNFGFQGDDILVGGRGNDALLEDGNGKDILRGGPNRRDKDAFFSTDFLQPGGGADKVFGGPGPDLVFVENDGRRDVIRCGRGRDVVDYSKAMDPRDVIIGCETVRGHVS